MSFLLDTSVVIALSLEKEPAHLWSVGALQDSSSKGEVCVCDTVFAEAVHAFGSIESFNLFLEDLLLTRVKYSDADLFRAGQAFRRYKDDNKGPKLGVLPDFFIGAAAANRRWSLITLNPKDFASYFEGLALIHNG